MPGRAGLKSSTGTRPKTLKRRVSTAVVQRFCNAFRTVIRVIRLPSIWRKSAIFAGAIHSVSSGFHTVIWIWVANPVAKLFRSLRTHRDGARPRPGRAMIDVSALPDSAGRPRSPGRDRRVCLNEDSTLRVYVGASAGRGFIQTRGLGSGQARHGIGGASGRGWVRGRPLALRGGLPPVSRCLGIGARPMRHDQPRLRGRPSIP